MAKAKGLEVVVIVKCVNRDCKATREIRAGEVDPEIGMPFCERCGSVMVAERAKTKAIR